MLAAAAACVKVDRLLLGFASLSGWSRDTTTVVVSVAPLMYYTPLPWQQAGYWWGIFAIHVQLSVPLVECVFRAQQREWLWR